MLLGDCEICTTSETPYNQRKPGRSMKFSGERSVFSCSDCANKWHEHLHDTEAYRTRLALENEYDAILVLAQASPRDNSRAEDWAERIKEIRTQTAALDEQFYTLSGVWILEQQKLALEKLEKESV